MVAGATGNLGNRVCREFVKRGAAVSAIVRSSTEPEKIEALEKTGVKVLEVDLNSTEEIARACTGIECVVSALADLADLIVD